MGQNTYTQSPDSARWTYISGGALGTNNIKIGNVWRYHLLERVNTVGSNDNGSAPMLAHTINHEVGHLLGLWHPFDAFINPPAQCADTPHNNGDRGAGNNLMDYNLRDALTPCQLDILHQLMRQQYFKPYTACNTGCEPVNSFFTLPASVTMTTSPTNPRPLGLLLDGRGSWVPGTGKSYKIYLYEANANGVMVAGTLSSIITTSGEPGLINLNTIFSAYPFQLNKRYGVYMSVTSDCYSHASTKYFTTQNVSSGRATAAPTIVELYPNPTTTGEFSVRTFGSEPVRVSIRDTYGKLVAATLLENTAAGDGSQATTRTGTYRIAAPRPGLYMVEIECGGKRTVRQLAVGK